MGYVHPIKRVFGGEIGGKRLAKKKDDARYVLTPKGIARVSMLRSGLITTSEEPRFDGFWALFEQGMRQAGYVEDDEKEQDC